jgi:hypothetical protein
MSLQIMHLECFSVHGVVLSKVNRGELSLLYSSSCARLLPLYFLANFMFRRNLGSIPLVLTYFCLLAFLIPFAWALCVELCAHVFFCCAGCSQRTDGNEEDDRGEGKHVVRPLAQLQPFVAGRSTRAGSIPTR